MAFDVELPLSVAAVLDVARPLGDEPTAEVLVVAERGRVRAYGASLACLLTVEAELPGTPDGRAAISADEFTHLIASAEGQPTVSVTLDNGALSRPGGAMRRVIHLPEVLRRATTGVALMTLLVDVDALVAAAQMMKRFAGPDEQVRISVRSGDPLVLEAGPATALVLATESEPGLTAKATRGTRRAAKPVPQTAGGCSNG